MEHATGFICVQKLLKNSHVEWLDSDGPLASCIQALPAIVDALSTGENLAYQGACSCPDCPCLPPAWCQRVQD